MPTKERAEKIKDVVAKRQRGLVLVLEDIHDPHNAEAILRSADAFGIQKVYFIFEKEKYYNPKKVGRASSSSANKWLDFEIFKSTKECLKRLKKDKYEIIATVLDKDSENLFETKLKDKKIAILVGNEHRGLSKTAIKMSDRKIIIPMAGMVQSLNVSVTAAIFLYEITRQRNPKMKKYLLKKREQNKLVKDFIER